MSGPNPSFLEQLRAAREAYPNDVVGRPELNLETLLLNKAEAIERLIEATQEFLYGEDPGNFSVLALVLAALNGMEQPQQSWMGECECGRGIYGCKKCRGDFS